MGTNGLRVQETFMYELSTRSENEVIDRPINFRSLLHLVMAYSNWSYPVQAVYCEKVD